ncbi:unnamed protein product [Closterium sp. NIES-53]
MPCLCCPTCFALPVALPACCLARDPHASLLALCPALPCSPCVALPCSLCATLPCSPRVALPCSLRAALPCSPRAVLPCSARAALPCSPRAAVPADGVSLLGQTSRSLPAPTTPTEPADEDVQRQYGADSLAYRQWTERNAVAQHAVQSLLPVDHRDHF